MTKDEALGRKVKPSTVQVTEGSKFVGSVFLYMFLALAITAAVAGIVGFAFSKTIFQQTGNVNNSFTTVIIVALCLYIPVLLWVQLAAIKNGKTMVPAYVIYAIVMGVLISSFTAFIPFWMIATAFGLTCLTFGLMALIAWTAKSNLSTLAVVASGLFFGAILMALFNIILGLIGRNNANITASVRTISWILSYVILIAVVLITIFDLRNVKEIAQNGGAGTNIALLCALSLYVDFIYIFIRILLILVRIFGTNR